MGRVLAPWGVQGAVKVTPLTDFAERFEPGARLYLAGERREVRASHWARGTVVLKFAGIDDATAAAGFRGEYLEIPESESMPLPKGEYYRWQLEGLAVVTTDGRPLGRVLHVLETGSADVLEIRGEGDATYLVPLLDAVVQIDIEAGRITVNPESVVTSQPARRSSGKEGGRP